MNASICPTVTARNADEYNQQMNRIAGFAARMHLDVSDGLFTSKLSDIDEVWWPGGVSADLHVMYQKPFDHVEEIIALQPRMVIVHAEADGQFVPFAESMHRHGIEVGVALLAKTPVETIVPALRLIDHVLVFSGNLGQFGGRVDFTLLDKVRDLKRHKPQLEVGWDGGVNADNAKQLADAGVDVLNVGGFIQKSEHPYKAYETLIKAVRR